MLIDCSRYSDDNVLIFISMIFFSLFTDEEFLTHFLIRCKNSMEKTKRKLEMYYSARALMPEIYSNRDIESEELAEALRTA